MTALSADFARQVLGEPDPGRLRRLLGALLTLGYRLSGRSRYDRLHIERVRGLPILVLPSVFNPRVLRSGDFFAATIARDRLGEGGAVLDLGTGTGVCAVFASRHARRVVAVDINPAAVRCAGINVVINDAAERIVCRHGDLFDSLAGERFDTIFFNPPFYFGRPADPRDAAWRAPDLATRFATHLDAHLAPRGRAYLLLSTCGDACPCFVDALVREGFELTVHAAKQYVNERITILQVRRCTE